MSTQVVPDQGRFQLYLNGRGSSFDRQFLTPEQRRHLLSWDYFLQRLGVDTPVKVGAVPNPF